MSYDIHFRANSKVDAKQQLAEAFDAATGKEPKHLTDRIPVQTLVSNFIDLAKVDETLELEVTVKGDLAFGVGGVHGANTVIRVDLVSRAET